MLTMLRKTLMPYVGWVCSWFSHAPRGFPPGNPVFPSPEKKNYNLQVFDASAYENGNVDNNNNDNEGDNDSGNNSQ